MTAKDPVAPPLVSVLVVTYQHAAYIEPCIQGILMQRTTFPVEILIGEDESTDGTREICVRLAEEHPDRIRLFLQSRKDVMYLMGRATGRANLLHVLNRAKGKYIALCEGDDYWIDPLKLQRQVDALEADDRYPACFTNAWNEAEGLRTEYLDGSYAPVPGPIVEQRELVNGQGLPTCTFLCRRDKLFPLPKALKESPTADTLIYTHVSNHGPFLYLPIFTAVRRVHPGGSHSMKSYLFKRLVTLNMLPFMDEVSHHRQHAVIEARIFRIAITSWSFCMNGENKAMAKLCWKVIAKRRDQADWSRLRTARNYLYVYHPWLERSFLKVFGGAHLRGLRRWLSTKRG